MKALITALRRLLYSSSIKPEVTNLEASLLQQLTIVATVLYTFVTLKNSGNKIITHTSNNLYLSLWFTYNLLMPGNCYTLIFSYGLLELLNWPWPPPIKLCFHCFQEGVTLSDVSLQIFSPFQSKYWKYIITQIL